KKIEEIQVGDRVVAYDMLGTRLVSKGLQVDGVSARQHDGELIEVSCAGHVSRYTPEHHCIVHAGPAFADAGGILYLMRRGNSYRVGITSAVHGRQGPHRTSGVAGRLREERGEALWVLQVFADRREALKAEAVVTGRFGIPDLIFKTGGGLRYRLSDQDLDE